MASLYYGCLLFFHLKFIFTFNQRLPEFKQADQLVAYLQKAFRAPHGPEMRCLYNELFTHFNAADVHMVGTVGRAEFDRLIETSAVLVRELGLAPKTSAMYKNTDARFKSRTAMFNSMDANRSNSITWDEYLNFTKVHIMQKLESLDD